MNKPNHLLSARGKLDVASLDIHEVLKAHQQQAMSKAFVSPLARALALLSVFSPGNRWLGTREIVQLTELPVTTAVRLLHSLTLLKYLYFDEEKQKYRLTAKVLTLGYAAIVYSEILRRAIPHMQNLAESTDTCVLLGSRDRLALVVMEICMSKSRQVNKHGYSSRPTISVGTRLPIAESPLGWALLASLPELERSYLVSNIERRSSRDWARMRRRFIEATLQLRDKGYCSSLGEWDPDIGIVAAPLMITGSSPLVVACLGIGSHMTNARIDRELGRKLLSLTNKLEEEIILEESF